MSRSSLCPKCNKRCETTHDLNGESVAVCDGCGRVWRLDTALEYARGIEPDAKLGRMVRRLPKYGKIEHADGRWMVARPPFYAPDANGIPVPTCVFCDTPEEALERAMGEGE